MNIRYYILVFLLYSLAATNANGAVLTVTNGNDSGAGSLRQAILDASDTDTIIFDGSYTIPLASEIKLNKSLVIDALNNVVVLDGGAVNLDGTSTDEGTRILKVEGSLNDFVIRNIKFQNGFYTNTGGGDAGGAMVIKSGISSLKVEQCTFENNYSNHREGGAIYIQLEGAEEIHFSECQFTGNQALNGKSGGALAITKLWNASDITGKLWISSCSFTNNLAEGNGGAIFADNFTNPDVAIFNSVFSNNESKGDRGGGAVYDILGMKYYNCVFNENIASHSSKGSGGAIMTHWLRPVSRSMDLQNCLFYDNTAAVDGGGVYCWGNDEKYTFTNCTFYNNLAQSGNAGAIYVENEIHEISNSIFYKNYSGQDIVSLSAGSPGKFTGLNNAFDDFSNFNDSYDKTTWVELTVDPFQNSANGNFKLDNLNGAACLNSGNQALIQEDSLDLDNDMNTTEKIDTDLDSNARVLLGEVDMGAYESPYPAFIDLSNVDYDLAEGLILNTSLLMEYSLNSTDGTDGTWRACEENQTSADISLDGGFEIWVRQSAVTINSRNIGTVPVWEDRLQIAIDAIPDTVICNENTDQNLETLVSEILSQAKETIGFSILLEDVSKHLSINNDNADINYGNEEVTDSVYFKITNLDGVEEVIGRRVLVPKGQAYIEVEMLQVLLPEVLNPLENTDYNILTMLSDIAVDAGYNDVTFVVVDHSNNTAIDSDGNIAYGASAQNGTVEFSIISGAASKNTIIDIQVPVAESILVLNDAIASLPATIDVVERWDTNLVSVVNSLLSGSGFGEINVVFKSSENSGIDENGQISYAAKQQNGNATLTLNHGEFNVDYIADVIIPVTSVTNIAEQEMLMNKIFADQTQNLLYIHSDNAIKWIKVIDLTGRVISTKSGSGRQLIVPTEDLKGIRIIVVKNENGNEFHRKVLL
jgi:predicted outer membrane repeat protein